MGRLSILGMMGLVMLVAVGLAALRNANEAWAGSMLLLTLGVVGVAILGTVHGRGRPRAAWLGFLVFAGGYLVLAFGPWLSDHVEPRLGTSTLIRYVQSRAVPPHSLDAIGQSAFAREHDNLVARLSLAKRVARSPNDPVIRRYEQALTAIDRKLSTLSIGPSPSPNRWRSILPGAANRDEFMQVGHSLIALLAGALGAIISARFHSSCRIEPPGDR